MQTTAVRNKHIGWSLTARHTGTQGPCDGHRQPIKWALDAHRTGNESPSLGLSMPITWSLSARVTGTQGPANVLIPNCSCLHLIPG